MARQPNAFSRLMSLLLLHCMTVRVVSLRIATTTTELSRSAFAGSLQRIQAHRSLLTRARPAESSSATTTTMMAWTNPGGSGQKRPIHQHHTPSPEELERRVRQKVTEVASAVDSFLGGGDSQAQSEALAMHARYREQGEVAPASSSSSSSSSYSPYGYGAPTSFSAAAHSHAHSPPGGGSYAASGSGSGSGSAGPSFAHTTRPDFHGYLADSYLPAEQQSALSAGAAGAGNRLGLGRGGGLGFGLGLGLGSGKDASGVVDGMGAIGSFFGVNMNMNHNKPKRRRVSNLDFD